MHASFLRLIHKSTSRLVGVVNGITKSRSFKTRRSKRNTYDEILEKLINGPAKSQVPSLSSAQLQVISNNKFFLTNIPPPPLPPKPRILGEKKETTKDKEFAPVPHSSRKVYNALKTYEEAEQVTSAGIVAANLQLNGITNIPENFRQALLKHPYLSVLDKHDRLSTQEQKVELLFFVSQNSTLKDEIILYDNVLWRVESDTTKNPSDYKDQSSPILLRSIVIKNTNNHHTIDIYEHYILLDNKKIDSSTVFICKFKLCSRISPFYDKYGILSGIELAFFELKTLKTTFEHDQTTVKDKLYIGVTSGSSSIIYDSKAPKNEICSWCAESSLTAAEVLIRREDVAKKLGLSKILSQDSTWPYDCRITFCASSHELINMPRHPSTKNIIIIVGNYGYDINVHRDVLKFVGHLIKNKMTVKIIMPMAKYIGIKIKLNDILCKYGINSAANVMLRAVTINSILDLEPIAQPLQLLIQLLRLKEQLKTEPNNHYLIIKIIQIYIDLRKENIAEKYCRKIYFQLLKLPQNNLNILAQLHHAFGSIYYHNNELQIAKIHLFESLELKKSIGGNLAKLYLDIGLIYSVENNFLLASDYYKKALNAIKAKPTKSYDLELSEIYLAFGNLYFKNIDFNRAKTFYQKSIKHCILFFGDDNHVELAKAHKKLGLLFFKQKEYANAFESYNKYMTIMRKAFANIDFPKKATVTLHIAEILFALGKRIDSIEYYVQLFQENEKHNVLNLTLNKARRICTNYRTQLLATLSKESITKRNEHVFSLIAEASQNNTLVMVRAKNLSKVKYFPNIVIIDVEATGVGKKHYITEIACVVVENYTITGKVFHRYVNPGRRLDISAHRITGLTYTFLREFGKFSDIAEEFLEFIKGAALLMHDANSDLSYINTELRRINHKCGTLENYHPIIDSLELAQKLHPNQKNNLNSLCERYGIDTEKRTQKSGHGALLDAMLLAKVYFAMIQGETIIDEPQFGVFCKI